MGKVHDHQLGAVTEELSSGGVVRPSVLMLLAILAVSVILRLGAVAYLGNGVGVPSKSIHEYAEKHGITREQVSFLFWVNVGMSLLVALITAALGPLIASTGEPLRPSVAPPG